MGVHVVAIATVTDAYVAAIAIAAADLDILIANRGDAASDTVTTQVLYLFTAS